MGLKAKWNSIHSFKEPAERIKKTFFELHDRLTNAGFGMARSDKFSEEGKLVIYNRGLDKEGQPNGKSNYFVFVKVDKNSLKVSYTNPDFSPDAVKLASQDIHLIHIAPTYSKRWVDEVIDSVVQTAAKKPTDKYFAILHGHWGKIAGRDLLLEHIDDGISNDIDIIMLMAKYNIDKDGTGHHNHFIPALFDYVAKLETSLGIEKLPAVELTMPLAIAQKNGIHEVLIFASKEAATEYAGRVLGRRSGKYPPYAPLVDPEKLLQFNREFINAKLLAVIIAHPGCNTALPDVGILNKVANTDYDFKWAMEYVNQNAHGVSAFNLTNPTRKELEFRNPSERRFMLELLGKWNMGNKLTSNAVSMAFSLEMQARFGKFRIIEGDKHNWDSNEQGINVFDFTGRKVGSKPTSREIVELMLSPKAKDNIIPVIPYVFSKDGFIEIAPSRNQSNFFQKIEKTIAHVGSYMKIARNLAEDLWDSMNSLRR